MHRVRCGHDESGVFTSRRFKDSDATQSTLAAIQQAIERLKPQGILSVVAYTGHCGGREEAECVREAFSRLPHDRFTIEQIPSSSDTNAPILYVARRYGVATSSQSPSLAPARDKTS